MTSKIVVILVNYNRLDLTQACLESLKESEQSMPHVILIDNASDNPDELDQLHETYQHLTVLKNPVNVGFGLANNQGIQWAQDHIDFEYICLLNNDTIVTDNAITKMTEAFQPETGIVTCKIKYADNRDLIWYGGASFNATKGWPVIHGFNQPESDITNSGKNVAFASGCTMVFTKASITKLKGFTPDFFMYCEDFELSLRAQKLGYSIYYEPDALIYHKVQASQENDDAKKYLHPKNPNVHFLFYHTISNQYLTMKEHLPFGQFIVFNFYFWAKYTYFFGASIASGNFRFITTAFKTNGRIAKHLFKKLRIE